MVLVLGTAPDISQLFRFAFQQGQTADPEKSAPQGTLPSAASEPPAANQLGHSSSATSSSGGARLTEDSRLAILRAVSGEFVRAQISLPGGKEGLHIPANKPYVPPAERTSSATDSPHVYIAARAPVILPGEKIQITRVNFREKTIVLELNGGGTQKFHLRDHLQLDGPMSSAITQPGGPPGLEGHGATLFLDFGRALPDLSPDDLKLKLASVLDFRAQRSAAVQFAESLPPEFQQAIKDRTAAVGMDHEMVLAGMGRPDRKVRERDEDGIDTEDWIYGTPPQKTVFVTFQGEKVVRVRQFP